MRVWIVRWGVVLVVGTLLAALLGSLLGSGHDPNHDINMDEARAAARRVHTPPRLSPSDRDKIMRDHGG
jgi:hypothetical protein